MWVKIPALCRNGTIMVRHIALTAETGCLRLRAQAGADVMKGRESVQFLQTILGGQLVAFSQSGIIEHIAGQIMHCTAEIHQ